MTFLKKFWFPLFFLLVVMYVANSLYQSNVQTRKREELRAQQQLGIEKFELEAIKGLNANYKWIGDYSSDGLANLFAADLEKDWLGTQPVFFPGYLKDIFRLNDEEYLLHIKYSKVFYLLPSISLQLRCKKLLIDSFLKTNPQVRNVDPADSGVAVIARVEKLGVDDEKHFVGYGTCIEIFRDVGSLEQYNLLDLKKGKNE